MSFSVAALITGIPTIAVLITTPLMLVAEQCSDEDALDCAIFNRPTGSLALACSRRAVFAPFVRQWIATRASCGGNAIYCGTQGK
ncbi:MAG: hypothetical protein A3J28_12245 [Acidobacteria bacterium RIFCSPLOWO2_12_FULL_60_22]|nr:MAG: hypothetical protein A3J28_12245 [Acidobacteria bacterium RIFCSPLOWO2_12_FULL_60_22]